MRIFWGWGELMGSDNIQHGDDTNLNLKGAENVFFSMVRLTCVFSHEYGYNPVCPSET
jgi:hypothetical protein